MDSEHRHELEENVLATWLTTRIEELAPHATTIVGVVIAAVAAVVGWSAYQTTSSAGRADAWRTYTLAVEGREPSLDALRIAAEENPGTPVEDWALITWADGRLFNATNDFLRNKPRAIEALDEAETTYEQLLGSRDTAIADRAAFGLGRVAEMRGDLEAARDYYDRVGGLFTELADRRADQLEKPRVAASYAWLTGVKAESPEGETPAETSDEETAENTDEALDALLDSLTAEADAAEAEPEADAAVDSQDADTTDEEADGAEASDDDASDSE